jgi:hypothetical protein
VLRASAVFGGGEVLRGTRGKVQCDGGVAFGVVGRVLWASGLRNLEGCRRRPSCGALARRRRCASEREEIVSEDVGSACNILSTTTLSRESTSKAGDVLTMRA